MMFEYFDTEIPAAMAPLDCLKDMRDLEFGMGAWGDFITERWSAVPFLKRVSAALFPSALLLETLREMSDGFQLYGKDGRLLAEWGDGRKSLTADDDSILIQYPWDVLAVHEKILSKAGSSRSSGNIREGAVIDGTVMLGENSVLLPGVFIEGVAVIGKNCRIGPNCCLRGCTFIGDNCHIGQAVEIKNSILMHHVAVAHLSYFGDSVICPDTNIGGGTIASNFRHDGRNHRSMVNGALVETGRRKFGTVIGQGVHIGIHTSIYPGRKIWSGAATLPGEIVRKDIC